MAPSIQAIRGMNDILPSESFLWQLVEKTLAQTFQSYSYQEIRMPIVEKTDLFKRSIGEATDIVEKEMYTFMDRNGDNLTLRPEGTAGCVRAGLEHGLLYHQTQRLWYVGPYFRHERPQKGRYRQFYQCGVEAFGMPGPDIDAEVIILSATIFEKLGLKNFLTLQLNSLGSPDSRAAYRQELVTYLTDHQAELDEDSLRRLNTNPLRILDSKNPALTQLIANAPKLMHHLDAESADHFAQLQSYLSHYGIGFTLNPCLVRGLDYYTKTVFEWVTNELGAQGTVCAGGRYDGLVEQLGGKATPAIGFAIGLERLVLMLQQSQQQLTAPALDVFFMSDGTQTFQKALALADELRNNVENVSVLVHCGGGSLKNQFKKADKSGALFAFIIGENELQAGTVAIKSLRAHEEQVVISQDDLVNWLKRKMVLGH